MSLKKPVHFCLILGVMVSTILFARHANAQLFRINTINCKLKAEDLALLNRMGKFEANFYNQVFNTTRNDSVTVDINLYGKHREYNQVQKGELNTTFIDGFYSGRENKIYLYKGDDYMETLFHETSHNILRYNFPHAPKWLNEGIATLLGYLVETTDNQVLYVPQPGYIRQVRDSITARSFNLNNFFSYRDNDWLDKDKRPMLYAASYSIIYFLINQDKRDYLGQVLVLMQQGYSTPNAFKKVFGSTDAFAQKFYYFYVHGAGKRL